MRNSLRSLALGLSVGAVTVLCQSAFGQVDPVVTTPAGYIVLLGATDATINTYRGQGFRIIDIDRIGTNQYDAVMVQNSGDYANPGEVWYPNITEGSLNSALAGKRLIDLQPWDSSGSTLFTAVAVSNTGDDAVPGWGWLYNQTSASAIDSWMSGGTLRPISIQRYTVGGNSRWSGVAISNTGGAAAGHWYLWGATTSTISSTLAQLGGVITDVELNTQGTLFAAPTFNVTAVIKPIRGWWWYTALDASQILPQAEALGARPIDIERYTSQTGQTRYFVVYVDNTNAIESRLRSRFDPATDGDYGFYAKEVGGPVVAQLNQNFDVEPASTMKIAQGIRVAQLAQQGQFGASALDLLVFNNDTTNPTECPDGVNSNPAIEPIREVMRRMFSVSDNNATKEISDLCGGYPAISTWLGTIAAGAISQLEINHELGCLDCVGGDFNVAPPRAICDLYEAAYDGTLLNSTYRAELWSVVSGSNTDASFWFDSVIDEEAQGLALTDFELQQFRSQLWYRLKNGGYSCNGWYGSQAGIVRIPYKSGADTIYERTFTGMTFVHDASSEKGIAIAYSSWAELFREQIREALVTWDDACVQPPVIVSQPQSQIVTAGQNVAFSVAATGSGTLTYQWRRDNSPISDGGNVSGTSTPTLQILAASDANEGWYRCIVTNPCGTISTATAILTVQPPACIGDLNGNGTVDAADLSALLGAWGSANAAADLDGNGSVGASDLATLLSRWGGCP